MPGRTNRGLPAGLPGTSCCLQVRNSQKKAFLPGHRPGVAGTSGRQAGFSEIYVMFSYVPFLLPKTVHTNFTQNLGRQLLGSTFSGTNHLRCVIQCLAIRCWEICHFDGGGNSSSCCLRDWHQENKRTHTHTNTQWGTPEKGCCLEGALRP